MEKYEKALIQNNFELASPNQILHLILINVSITE